MNFNRRDVAFQEKRRKGDGREKENRKIGNIHHGND